MWNTVLVINLLYLTSITNDVEGQGRVAPGVPPQHYQQAPQQFQQPQFKQVPVQQQMPPQQMQPQQQQMPQQQMHHQQIPQQQMHQQVPIQQQQHVPQQPHHAHHSMPQPGQLLNTANINQEKEHIAEHMEVPIDTSKMTDQELQFHYFKMHDADNNNKLDGCELIKSLIHWHDPAKKDSQTILTDEELVELVDPLLKTIDENNDGYVDYTEYKKNI